MKRLCSVWFPLYVCACRLFARDGQGVPFFSFYFFSPTGSCHMQAKAMFRNKGSGESIRISRLEYGSAGTYAALQPEGFYSPWKGVAVLGDL